MDLKDNNPILYFTFSLESKHFSFFVMENHYKLKFIFISVHQCKGISAEHWCVIKVDKKDAYSTPEYTCNDDVGFSTVIQLTRQ